MCECTGDPLHKLLQLHQLFVLQHLPVVVIAAVQVGHGLCQPQANA
jgi:hypothetical protein